MCMQKMPSEIESNLNSVAMLPTGQTCGNCANFSTCADLENIDPKSTRCDFIPSKFRHSYGWRV